MRSKNERLGWLLIIGCAAVIVGQAVRGLGYHFGWW